MPTALWTTEKLDQWTTKSTFANGSYVITTYEVEDECSYELSYLYNRSGERIQISPETERSLRGAYGSDWDLYKVEQFMFFNG